MAPGHFPQHLLRSAALFPGSLFTLSLLYSSLLGKHQVRAGGRCRRPPRHRPEAPPPLPTGRDSRSNGLETPSPPFPKGEHVTQSDEGGVNQAMARGEFPQRHEAQMSGKEERHQMTNRHRLPELTVRGHRPLPQSKGSGSSTSSLADVTFTNALPSPGLGPAVSGRPIRGCTGRRGLVTPALSPSAKPQVSLQPDLEEKSTELTSQENLKFTLFSKLFSISHGEKRLIHLVNKQRSYFSTFGHVNIKEKIKT